MQCLYINKNILIIGIYLGSNDILKYFSAMFNKRYMNEVSKTFLSHWRSWTIVEKNYRLIFEYLDLFFLIILDFLLRLLVFTFRLLLLLIWYVLQVAFEVFRVNILLFIEIHDLI